MSGSMAPAMALCREAVKRFLATVRPVDHVTLLAFNDSVFTVSRREASPEARLRAVDRLRAWGSTALYDAVLRGLDLLEKHRGRRALVLFTDGEDMGSHATVDDIRRRIEVSATPVYVGRAGQGMREAGLKGILDRVAGVSGGRAFYTDRVEELEGVFSEIGEDIASQYLLAYAPADVVRDGGWRTIRVEVAERSTRSGRGRATARRPGEVSMRVIPYVIAAVLAASARVPAQSPEGAAQQPPVFGVGVDVVAVDSSVVDADGRPVLGLGPGTSRSRWTASRDGWCRSSTWGATSSRPRRPVPARRTSAATRTLRGAGSSCSWSIAATSAGQGPRGAQGRGALPRHAGPGDRVGLAFVPGPGRASSSRPRSRTSGGA